MSDEAFPGIEPWLRFTPFLTGLFAALGTISKFPFALFVLAGLSLLGVVLPRHPFDYLYQNFIRHFENSPSLPFSPGLRRLVYGLQALAIAGVALGFTVGHARIASTLGWAIAAEAAWLAAHQISLVSECWTRLFGKRPGASAG